MGQTAFVWGCLTLYRYPLILALSAAAGFCCFMACCAHREILPDRAITAAVLAGVLGLLLSRLLFWYGRPDRFRSLYQALTSADAEQFALSGAFLGCGLSGLLLGGSRKGRLLDCMSLSGCGAIALGRLGLLFTGADRGQILKKLTAFPLAGPVINRTSGAVEYRLATFLLQSLAAGLLFLLLARCFFSKRSRLRSGDLSLLFLMGYGASQIVLDSTRYDALYLRSNGFISLTQLLAACGLILGFAGISARAIRRRGFRRWMPALWGGAVLAFGGAGYMEYYVQRHGRQALFAYSVMSLCLMTVLICGICLWRWSVRRTKSKAARNP